MEVKQDTHTGPKCKQKQKFIYVLQFWNWYYMLINVSKFTNYVDVKKVRQLFEDTLYFITGGTDQTENAES